jgi:hypothetical protein
MALERFVILNVEPLGDDGKTVEFIYSDLFDPEKLKEMVVDPDTPPEKRYKIKNRLWQANAVTAEELKELHPKSTD